MRALAAAGLVAALGAGAGAAARAAPPRVPVGLPPSVLPLTPAPPLQTRFQRFPEERAFHGAVTSDERVLVSLDSGGLPIAIRVVQRLVLAQKGDYTFVVPAPVLDVTESSGSESAPGMRRGAILWRGFSAGRRILVADALLRAADAGRFLPVRVSLSTRAGRTTLTVRNATSVRISSYSANAVPAQAAAALDRIRIAAERGADVGGASLTARGIPTPTVELTHAPLAVEGELRAGSRVRFSAVLGDGGRSSLRVTARGSQRPVLVLRVRPVPPRRELEPPGAATWADALASGAAPRDGRRLFDRALRTLHRLARAHQYDQFLRNPDPAGRSRTIYVFRTAVTRATPAGPSVETGSTSGAWTVLAIVLAAAGATGLAVLWAHS